VPVVRALSQTVGGAARKKARSDSPAAAFPTSAESGPALEQDAGPLVVLILPRRCLQTATPNNPDGGNRGADRRQAAETGRTGIVRPRVSFARADAPFANLGAGRVNIRSTVASRVRPSPGACRPTFQGHPTVFLSTGARVNPRPKVIAPSSKGQRLTDTVRKARRAWRLESGQRRGLLAGVAADIEEAGGAPALPGVRHPDPDLRARWSVQAISMVSSTFSLDADDFDPRHAAAKPCRLRGRKTTGRPLGYHLKIDTGMNRPRFSSRQTLRRTLPELVEPAPNLRLEAILYAHFATADEPGRTPFSSISQRVKFRDPQLTTIEQLKGGSPTPCSPPPTAAATLRRFRAVLGTTWFAPGPAALRQSSQPPLASTMPGDACHGSLTSPRCRGERRFRTR